MKSLMYYIVVLIVIFSVSSCKSKRVVVVEEKQEEKQEETDMFASCYQIDNFSVTSCRLEVSGSNIQSVSLSGSIFIIPDSIFFFRGRLLIDVVRGIIYRDSFVVVNYLERTVFKGKNEFLENMVGFQVNPKSLLMLLTDDDCWNKYFYDNRRGQRFRVDYDAYRQYSQFELPTVINISANDGRNNFRVRADFRQLTLDTHEDIHLNVPANYRVVVLE